MSASENPSSTGGAKPPMPAQPTLAGLPRRVLMRCFLRSLALQASWNTKGMQNLGFLYAMEPAIDRLYPDPQERAAALTRHLTPFNSHPYMASAILGGAIHHEAAVAERRIAESRVNEFKQALAGPLAALGDSFFWGSWRPLTAALAVLLASFVGIWSLLVFLAVYNLLHLAVRLHMFRAGLRLGDGILDAVGALNLAGRTTRVKRMGAALVSMAAVALVTTKSASLGYSDAWVPIAVVLGGAVMVPLVGFFRSPYLLLLAAAAAGVVFGVVGIVGTV